MNVKMALLAGSVLAMPALAMAQPVSGLYVGAGLGVNFMQNQTVKSIDLGAAGVSTQHYHPKFDLGPVGVISLGYGLGNGLRVEVEGDYRTNEIRSVGGIGAASGRNQQYGAMANVLYDVDLASYGIGFMSPYLGVGAGWMQNDADNIHVGDGAPGNATVNKATNGLAVQGIVGAAVPMDQFVPGLAATVEYRIMDMPEDRKYTTTVDLGGGAFASGKTKLSDDFNHSIMLGFRYALNAPVPPPPAPTPAPAPVASPAPPPARTYLVFFDWDKADLTARARQIIADAAANVAKVKVTRIEVNGYTDLSGTPAYNQKLSVRRADSVAAELVKDGVPKSEIAIQGFGETHPLVPTAAGVREPQNRRVEIILK